GNNGIADRDVGVVENTERGAFIAGDGAVLDCQVSVRADADTAVTREIGVAPSFVAVDRGIDEERRAAIEDLHAAAVNDRLVAGQGGIDDLQLSSGPDAAARA